MSVQKFALFLIVTLEVWSNKSGHCSPYDHIWKATSVFGLFPSILKNEGPANKYIASAC